MKILILNWKDINNPNAGGAELVIHELAKRLVQDDNEVTLLTSAFKNSLRNEKIDGVGVIRIGNSRYTHNLKAINYYRKNLKNKFDIIIECVNTAPYLANLFRGREKVILFYHQLAREIWFYETRFPINIIGYLLEPIYTFIQSRFQNQVITVSNSTKQDLMNYGFTSKQINIITQGTNISTSPLAISSSEKAHCYSHLAPNRASKFALGATQLSGAKCDKLNANSEKPRAKSYILYLGSLRAMKRPSHALKAFAHFALSSSNQAKCELRFAGTGPEREIDWLKKYIKTHKLDGKVKLLGRVDEKKKLELLANAFVLIVPSLKEGWGLVVTEAAKLGTPSIVYDVDGLRDSVKDGITGYVVENGNPEAITEKIELLMNDKTIYTKMRNNCIKNSQINTFDQSYKDFRKLISCL